MPADAATDRARTSSRSGPRPHEPRGPRPARRADLVVLGGGAGGLIAAREGARRGADVVMVQDGPVGGDCTFTGCVPSKALLAAAAAGTDFDTAMARVRAAVDRIAATEDAATLRREGIDVIEGRGHVRARDLVDVDTGTRTVRVAADRIIVATGARPTMPPIPGLRDADPLTSDTVFDLRARPASLIVLGGGPIGCELAQAFARLGTTTTLVEEAERVLPREEPAASEVVAAALAANGVEVRTGAAVSRVTVGPRPPAGPGDVTVHTGDGGRATATALLAAVGRTPAGRDIGLEEVGVAIDGRGAVVVDATAATTVDGIYAVGDVTGGLQFTHVAGRMGWIAASNALSRLARVRRFRLDTDLVPWATFTTPEVGRVGLTEAEAAHRHPGARVAHLPLDRVDRAIATGATDGFVRLVAAPRRGTRHLGGGRLVGATIVAPTGGDLIHEVALAMQTNAFVGRLAQTVHAYPSWAGAIQQAALQFFGTSSGLTARPAGTAAGDRVPGTRPVS